jgi:hypothetical protein
MPIREEPMLRVRWMAVLFVAAGVSLAACGGDGSGGPRDTGDDADVATDTQIDQPETNVCGDRTPCRGNADCNATTEVCLSGCCEPRTVEGNCTRQDQACAGDDWSNNNFLCDTGLGLCLTRCDTDEPTCPNASWCFPLLDPGTAALDGACYSGDCCTPGGACDFACNDGTGTCYAAGNNAAFCLDGGNVGAGGACTVISENPAQVCQPGLFCLNGTCVEPCDSNDDCGDEECVPVFDQTNTYRPGVCGQACDAFSAGECDGDEQCEFRIGAFSGIITAWLCADPENPSAPVVVDPIFGTCDPDGVTNRCPEGHFCDELADGTGRCVQFCDPSLQGTAALAHCQMTEGASIFLDQNDDEQFFAYGMISDTAVVEAAENATLQVALESGGEVALASRVNLADGTASTAIAHLDGGDESLSVFVDLDGPADLGTDRAGLRAYNVTGSALDVYRVEPILMEPVAPDDSVMWFTLSFGAAGTGFYWAAFEDDDFVDWAFDHIASADEPETEIVEIVVMDGDPVRAVWLDTEVPADLATTGAAIRVVNASTSRATVAVDFPGTAHDVAALEFGESTDYAVILIAADGVFTFTITASWTGEGAGSASSTLTRGRGDLTTLVLWDDPQAAATVFREDNFTVADAPDAGDDDIVFRVINVSTFEVALGQEVDGKVGDLGAGATLPVADGAIDVDPGAFVLALRADGAALSVAPVHLAVDDLLELEEGDYGQLYVYALPGGGLGSVMQPWVPFDVSTLDDGEAGLRFVHLIEGAGEATAQFRGEQLQVCAPSSLSGLGLCSWPCDPYASDLGPLVDDNGALTNRWMENGCPNNADPNNPIAWGCLAFVTNNEEFIPFERPGLPDLHGFCLDRLRANATRNFGESCLVAGGATDAVCNPDSFCVGLEADAAGNLSRAECISLCLPFSGRRDSNCLDGTVCINGSFEQSYGFCLEEELFVAARRGQTCPGGADSNFRFCREDDSFCFAAQQGGNPVCTTFCKRGVAESCPDGFTCRNEQIFIEPYDYIGQCIPG